MADLALTGRLVGYEDIVRLCEVITNLAGEQPVIKAEKQGWSVSVPGIDRTEIRDDLVEALLRLLQVISEAT